MIILIAHLADARKSELTDFNTHESICNAARQPATQAADSHKLADHNWRERGATVSFQPAAGSHPIWWGWRGDRRDTDPVALYCDSMAGLPKVAAVVAERHTGQAG